MYSLVTNDTADGSVLSNEIWWHSLENWYFLSQIAVLFALVVGAAFTVQSIRLARKNLRQIEIINKDNNDIQLKRVLQERLIELSHEWNSREFIEARNKAAITLSQMPEGIADVHSDLIRHNRIDDWVDISMVAHFFIRLSSIQKSHQIDEYNAKSEFQEAIAYWIKPLLQAYQSDPSELRLRNALIYIHDTYNDHKPYEPGFDR